MIAAGFKLSEIDCASSLREPLKCMEDLNGYLMAGICTNPENECPPPPADAEPSVQEAYKRLKLLADGDCRKAYPQNCRTTSVDAQDAIPIKPFFALNFRAGSDIQITGGWDVPEIEGQMSLSRAPIGGGIRVGGYAYAAKNDYFLFKFYGGFEGVFPLLQRDAAGNSYQPKPIFLFFGGVSPCLREGKERRKFNFVIGMPVEFGGSFSGADLTISAPILGIVTYGFLRFGPEALFRIPTGGNLALELGLRYMWTPRFGKNFGQHTAIVGDNEVNVWVGEHLFMFLFGMAQF
jgi:hypothetical protein